MAMRTSQELTPEQQQTRKDQADARRARNLAKAQETVKGLPSGDQVTLLRIEDIEVIAQRSRAALYRDLAAGRMPVPVRIGKRCTRWRLSAIHSWLAGE